MKKLFKVMLIAALILFLGTAGAVDQETITWETAIIQTTVSVILGLIGWLGLNEGRRR